MNGDLAPLLQIMSDWRTYAVAVLAFGFFPGFVLRLFLMLYPKDDDRRIELPGEMYALPRRKRWMYVAEQMETAIFEGPSERRKHKAVMTTSRPDTKELGDTSNDDEIPRWIRARRNTTVHVLDEDGRTVKIVDTQGGRRFELPEDQVGDLATTFAADAKRQHDIARRASKRIGRATMRRFL